ncbi:GNAT family N-acetyltransferase [Bremerella sp. P1]|uniref:GNAT family N-acetyltransferase n=1 Tax=Bremerella sp. P1 TaxID=3026424 RepID=UPI0023676BB0|nr:GNAT family N-acetyltransferase [Bremerella sp. P1]WDI41835.1 GNAT family N-acetyltransferase [Bremerella sp. P1]
MINIQRQFCPIDKTCWQWFALNEGKVVGYVHAKRDESGLFVSNLFVEEAHRRQGIGKQLMESVEELAREEGFFGVRLQVDPAITDLDFYHSQGYWCLGTIHTYGKKLGG